MPQHPAGRSDRSGGSILLCGYGPGARDLNKNKEVHDNLVESSARLIHHTPGITRVVQELGDGNGT